MNKPKLYLMVGISASGKSTIAAQMAEKEKAIIISYDEIRGELCNGDIADQSKNEEVFKIFHKRIRDHLLNGKNVIADATNITMKSRRAILGNVQKINCEKICYIVPKCIETCIEDDMKRSFHVGKDVILNQVKRFEIHFHEEKWEQIIIHNTDENNGEYIIDDLIDQMKNFDQENPHHTMTLYNHCLHSFELFRNKYDYQDYYVLASFFHDIGKLFTKTYNEGEVAQYFSHHNYGTYLLLTFKNEMQDIYGCIAFDSCFLDFLFLVNYHMHPFFLGKCKDANLNKWKQRFGEYKFKLLYDFHECDISR